MASQRNSHTQSSNPAPVFCPLLPTAHHPPGSPATPGRERTAPFVGRGSTSTWAGTSRDRLPPGDAGEPGLGADHTSQRLGLPSVQWGSDTPLAGSGAQTRPPRGAAGRTAHLSRWGSPVQVEGGDLRIVSLVVREVKKVRGRLLLSRLPRENGAKQRARALRTPSGGRLVPARERRLLDFQEFCEPVLTQSSLGTV